LLDRPLFGRSLHARSSGQPRRIGLLMLYPAKDPQGELRALVFQHELEKAGWTVGGNLQINFHWGTGDADWVRSAIAQILGQSPDVMLAKRRCGGKSGTTVNPNRSHNLHR
jgi:putative ABC transport system substrate-binding protein